MGEASTAFSLTTKGGKVFAKFLATALADTFSSYVTGIALSIIGLIVASLSVWASIFGWPGWIVFLLDVAS